MNWTSYTFGAFAGCQLSCILLVILCLIVGLASILSRKKAFIIIFFILDIIICLYILFVIIFSFIGTRVKYLNDYIGCNSKYKAILSNWKSVDIYLQSIDEQFCSENCQCSANRTLIEKFSYNQIYAPYLYYLNFVNNTAAPHKFQDCPNDAKELAYNNYKVRNHYYKHKINQKKFQKYYKNLEKFFKCTGFCSTTYFNEYTGTTMKMFRYLFTDISNGIPEHIGCLNPLLNWLNKNINAFGSLSLILLIILILLLFFAIKFLIILHDEYKENERINREVIDSSKINENFVEDDNKQNSIIKNNDVEDRSVVEYKPAVEYKSAIEDKPKIEIKPFNDENSELESQEFLQYIGNRKYYEEENINKNININQIMTENARLNNIPINSDKPINSINNDDNKSLNSNLTISSKINTSYQPSESQVDESRVNFDPSKFS